MYTSLNSRLELWSACAGELTQIPKVNSCVYYFAQGHSEHSNDHNLASNMLSDMRTPFSLLCTVESVNFLAEHRTDKILARIKLRPQLGNQQPPNNVDPGIISEAGPCVRETYVLFLAQRNELKIKEVVAAMLFPKVSEGQNVRCMDVHGAIWEFRLTYERRPGGLRGPPILTEGWEAFVTAKGLVAKDLIIFMRDKNGALRIGIRHWRIKRSSVEPIHVVNAAKLALEGKPFEVLFYPRVATPEFVIEKGDYDSAMSVPWKKGSKVLMRYEEEEYDHEVMYKQVDYGQGSNTCEGQVLLLNPDDSRWPHSPWKRLAVSIPTYNNKVTIKRASPWTVTFLSNP